MPLHAAKDLEMMKGEGLATPELPPETPKQEWSHEHMLLNKRNPTFGTVVKMRKRL